MTVDPVRRKYIRELSDSLFNRPSRINGGVAFGTQTQFETWTRGVAQRFGYAVRFLPVGPEDMELGAPTQMEVFQFGP